MIQIAAVGDGWTIGIYLVAGLAACALAAALVLREKERYAMEQAGDSQLPSAVRSGAIAWISRRAARPGAGQLRGRVSSLLAELKTYDRNSAVRRAAAAALRELLESSDCH
jgi:hypothetical protein